MSTCKDCRYFYPMYFQVGRCTRSEGTHMGAKMFTDDGKARILVHISFGCVQFEKQEEVEKDTL